MKHSILALFTVLLLLAAPAHADVGPPPTHPGISVTMMKDGNPDLRVTMITYHCMGVETSDNGAVSAKLVDIACAEGICKSDNGAGLYKFNPCNDWPEGYFSYTLNGQTIKTDYFNNTAEHDYYEMTVDSESGKITSNNGSDNPIPNPGCLPFIALTALAGAVFVVKK